MLLKLPKYALGQYSKILFIILKLWSMNQPVARLLLWYHPLLYHPIYIVSKIVLINTCALLVYRAIKYTYTLNKC